MKTFIAISALALALSSTTINAQLSNAPKRLRTTTTDNGIKEREQLRELGQSSSSSSSSSSSLQQTNRKLSEDPCKEKNKRKCMKDISCTWDHESGCRTTLISLGFVARQQSLHSVTSVEQLDFDMSMPVVVDMMETPTTKPESAAASASAAKDDPCKVLSKKKCRKDESCTWDDPDCYATPTTFVVEPVRRKRDFSVQVELDLSMPAVEEVVDTMVEAPTAPSTTTTTTTTTIDVPCEEETNKKKCKKDPSCKWDGSICYTTLVQLEFRIQDFDMSMSDADIDDMMMEEAVDPCTMFTKKKCRKEDMCTWDDPICYKKELDSRTMRARTLGDVEEQPMSMSFEPIVMSMPIVDDVTEASASTNLTEPTADEEEEETSIEKEFSLPNSVRSVVAPTAALIIVFAMGCFMPM